MSDTAYEDASSDKSGPLLRTIIEQEGSDYAFHSSSIVQDHASSIRQAVMEAVASGASLVLTTGGTGFATRDVTPEAISPLIAKPAPGLVQLMLQTSLKITPLAALARPVAGLTEQNTLIITLPGSPKGAKENFEALLPVLKHALQLSSGNTSSRELHQSSSGTQSSASAAVSGCSGHHHHHDGAPKPKTHDPSLGCMIVSDNGILNVTN